MSQQPSIGSIAAPKKQLLRGMLIAAAAAAVVLTVAVLPAEYGIDPTGIGKSLGLTALHQEAPATSPTPKKANSAGSGLTLYAPTTGKISAVAAKGEVRVQTVTAQQAPAYRTDVLEVTLAPGRGLEVKTHLAKGASLVYSWKTANGELVNHDFHGEPVDAGKDEFESFIVEQNVAQSRGVLIAPFSGMHGWYWKNKGTTPVTVSLSASGFYTEIYKK